MKYAVKYGNITLCTMYYESKKEKMQIFEKNSKKKVK